MHIVSEQQVFADGAKCFLMSKEICVINCTSKWSFNKTTRHIQKAGMNGDAAETVAALVSDSNKIGEYIKAGQQSHPNTVINLSDVVFMCHR